MSKLLLVLNQETITEQILLQIRSIQPSSCYILSTHYLFPDEISSVKDALGASALTVSTMSSLLSDFEMEECDNIAYEIASLNHPLGANSFMSYSRAIRNMKVRDKVSKIYDWNYSIVGSGLGLISSVWIDHRTVNKDTNESSPYLINREKKGRLLYLIERATKRLFKIVNYSFSTYRLVSSDSNHFCFLNDDITRLSFKSQVSILPVNRLLFDGLYKIKKISLFKRIIAQCVVLSPVFDAKPAVTVHSFSTHLAIDYPDLYVFVDGLHPPNYPKSYGLIYQGINIVRRSKIDETWFFKNGAYVHSFPNLINEIDFATLSASTKLSRRIKNDSPLRVVLMLNHAGDWSALIERSDTDQCVYEFCRAALLNSHIEYIIRPHPTMAHPQHEGILSLDRLTAYVSSLNLPNVSLSTKTLEGDIACTDVCVSEYSDVLVKCLLLGIPCICLNPSGRRSFLDFLTPNGLITVSTGEQLSEAITMIHNV